METNKQGMRILVGVVLGVFALLGTFSTTAFAQSPGTWTLTGSMTTPRTDGFRATLLTDGKVLVTGGSTAAFGSNWLSSAELYDPSTGIWTATGSMTSPRLDHSATLLPDGRVLVAGGQTQSCLTTSSVEIYDPNSGTWTPTASMTETRGRGRHIAALITSGPLSGMVLVAGGYVNQNDGGCGGTPGLSSAELYDPNTGTWSSTNSMALARAWETPSPATLSDGSVLAVGGNTCCPYHWFNEAELYDPVSQVWTPTSSKTTAANDRTALMPDGQVLVAGGVSGTQGGVHNNDVASAELFDSSNGMWTPTASMSTGRTNHTLTLLTSGEVLVAGGTTGAWSGPCQDLSSAEIYDSGSRTWSLTGRMTAPRYYHAAILLPNGQVLAAGGANCAGNVLSSAELYAPPPAVALSPASLMFSDQLLGTTSPAQTVTLTNTGPITLTISSVSTSGDFFQTNTCDSSVAPGASCAIDVSFKPTAKGTRTGALTITDNAANSPQTVSLTGTGTVVELSPARLSFGHQKVGTTSPPQTVTVKNTGGTSLTMTGVGITGTDFGDFADTTTCSSSLAPGQSCRLSVTFTPQAKGSRHASADVGDNGGGSPQRVALSGTGT